MRVEQTSRGRRKGAPRGRGRGQRKPFQKTDLVVTVPNEESGASRLKPPVSSTQPRKIVRINQNKTESTDLEKVTVKSLDEIKREKELRSKESAAHLSFPSSQGVYPPASKISNGYGSTTNSTENDINGSNYSHTLVKNKPSSHCGPFIATHAEPTSSTNVSSSSIAIHKLKDFSIPLKPLSTQSSAKCKILRGKPQVAAVSRHPYIEEHGTETREVPMDFDSKLAEQDFDFLDDDEEDSGSGGDFDEDFLLREHDEMETEEDPTLAQSRNSNISANDDGLSGYTYTSDEPEDDEISLHPDDSLFDEEDEPSTNNDRRTRSLGRRSGSQSKDLRSKLFDRNSGNPTNMVNRVDDSNEVKDEKQEMPVSSKQAESLPQSSKNKKHTRTSPRKRFNREQDNRHRAGDSRHFFDKRTGRAQFKGSAARRGRGSRQELRKESAMPPLPSLLPQGDGLLPCPAGAPHMGFISQLQTALMLNNANIANNLKTTVEMLTNPPPVPGEIVTNYEESSKHPTSLLGLPAVSSNFRSSGQHLKRRLQNNPSVRNAKQASTQPSQLSSQQNEKTSRNIPKWLQKTKKKESQVNVGREFSPNETNEEEQNTALPQKSEDKTGRKEIFEYASTRPADSIPIHHSPNSDRKVGMQSSLSKRRSPFQAEEVSYGGKIVVGTSPEGIPQPRILNTNPKQLCPEQLQTGSCANKRCQYWHLSHKELGEFQTERQLGHINSQDHSAEIKPAPVQQQTKVDVPDVSYDLVNALLKNGNLGAAWQMIEKLRSMNHPPDLSILQHVLSLCSKHLQEPDVAAQVAHNAFDMIGGMLVQHNRHNYETLIKTLCHSGQYIRAYEMLEEMKKDSHAPTYEVFLDLVQASEKDPEWAFSLLGEIKQSGVFRSKICSDLILLGCRSGEFFVERTWLLFQEALENQVQVTAEAISAMLFTLVQSNEWDKIMSVLPAVPEAVPSEILKHVMLMATQRVDWIETVIAVLALTAAEKLSVFGADVWNSFLSNCCITHGNNMSFAPRIHSLMQQNGIHLSPESVNTYMSALSHANNWRAALELFTTVHQDPQVTERPQALESGLIALSSVLQKKSASTGMLIVVHFMLEHHIKPEDSVLQAAVESLDNEKNYKGVQQFFKQLKANAIVPPLVVYKKIVSSLEQWSEDPEASLEPYACMRRAYPSGQSHASNKSEASSDSEKNELRKVVCKYIGTARGCFSGNKCKFLHPEVPLVMGEGSQPVLLQSSESVPAPAFQMVQQNMHGSEGSMPVAGAGAGAAGAAAAAGSETPPFLLQSTNANSLPFALNLGTVQGPPPFKPDDNTSSNGSMTSLKQGQGTQLCKFFGTPQGCHWGDNCRFIHLKSSVGMKVGPIAAASEVLPGGNSEVRVRDNRTGNPFVLRSLSSSSGFSGENPLFRRADNWQPTGTIMPTTRLPSMAPVPSTVHDAAVKPVMASNHFQLIGGSHLLGANPFSPNFPGRTQSVDSLSEHKATEHNQQAHSAPIVPERPRASHFHFPSQKNSQFYLPRIKFAAQQKSWEDLGYVYINMKNEDVEINNSVLEAFYQSFENYCALDTVGECFERFASRVNQHLADIMPELGPNHSPSSSFDDGDREFIGQLGVALMYFCYRGQHFVQGYTILHALHQFGINYSLYSGEFGMQKRPLTTTEVALTAADICLNLDQPAYDSALEVLRGTKFALPDDSRETMFTAEEGEWRRRVFQTLYNHFMHIKAFNSVHELLTEVGDIDIFGREKAKALFNEFIIVSINNGRLDLSAPVVKIMDAKLISRDSETTRALVKGFGDAGCGLQAKQHFRSGCISGIYPDSFKRDNPWTVVIGTSFSAFESQLYIERHLSSLYFHIEDLAFASGGGVLDDKFHRPLKVVIKSDEEQTMGSKFMRREEIIRCVREMLCTVLNNDFNPPLACQPQIRDEEVIVDALSLKRWFCANSASGRSKRGEVLLSASLANTSMSHPYLQPGMTSVVPSDGQEDRRVCVVSEDDSLVPQQLVAQGEQPQHIAFLNPHSQVSRARSMLPARTMSGRGLRTISKT